MQFPLVAFMAYGAHTICNVAESDSSRHASSLLLTPIRLHSGDLGEKRTRCGRIRLESLKNR